MTSRSDRDLRFRAATLADVPAVVVLEKPL